MPLPHARTLASWIGRILASFAIHLLLPVRKGARVAQDRHSVFDASDHLDGMRIPAPSRPWRGAVLSVLALVLLTGAGVYAGYEVKHSREARARAIALTGGNPDFGRRLTTRYGCAGCHTIPGVPGAQGRVGPSLDGIAAQVYIAGTVANTPNTLIRWIENPRAIDPKTAMPVTGLSQDEARHVAAYLYTLR
jgi:cytochrome c2